MRALTNPKAFSHFAVEVATEIPKAQHVCFVDALTFRIVNARAKAG